MLRKVVQPVYTWASTRVARVPTPLRTHIEAHEAAGTDITQAIWNEYVAAQRALITTRRDRFYEELRAVFNGRFSLATTTLPDVIVGLRCLTKCLFLFCVFTMVGRRQVFPLLEPTSPFLVEVLLRWTPAQRMARLSNAQYFS